MSKKAAKLKERRNKKIERIRSRRRKRLYLIISVIAVVTLLSWLTYTSKFFNVQEIKVKGNVNVSDQFVIEKSGIKRSQSMISLPSITVSKRLKKINWVDHAAIMKNWPYTVVIDIIERKPLAFMETDEDVYLIAKKGFIIDIIANYKGKKQLPKIDGLPVKKVKIGSRLKNDALDNALLAYTKLNKELQKDVFSITAKSVDELYFVAQGVEIIYGKAEKTRMKNEVIKTILKEKKETISTIDVRIPEKPVVRLLGK
ncbi:MAG TPA: FtsQ-type POTRA domain-containing protein [Actinobacteria bacterium]|nr:FtsQ-type POTRA domain-containing protein [Actinomycetota bacterium]